MQHRASSDGAEVTLPGQSNSECLSAPVRAMRSYSGVSCNILFSSFAFRKFLRIEEQHSTCRDDGSGKDKQHINDVVA